MIRHIRFNTLNEVIIISFAMFKRHSRVASQCAVHGSSPGRLLCGFSSPERSTPERLRSPSTSMERTYGFSTCVELPFNQELRYHIKIVTWARIPSQSVQEHRQTQVSPLATAAQLYINTLLEL